MILQLFRHFVSFSTGHWAQGKGLTERRPFPVSKSLLFVSSPFLPFSHSHYLSLFTFHFSLFTLHFLLISRSPLLSVSQSLSLHSPIHSGLFRPFRALFRCGLSIRGLRFASPTVAMFRPFRAISYLLSFYLLVALSFCR